jgi:hypothetical protein
MTKLISAVLAAFAVATISPAVFAQAKDGKAEATKALETACKGKKAGDVVKVDGKDTKCPEAKAAKTK